MTSAAQRGRRIIHIHLHLFMIPWKWSELCDMARGLSHWIQKQEVSRRHWSQRQQQHPMPTQGGASKMSEPTTHQGLIVHNSKLESSQGIALVACKVQVPTLFIRRHSPGMILLISFTDSNYHQGVRGGIGGGKNTPNPWLADNIFCQCICMGVGLLLPNHTGRWE